MDIDSKIEKTRDYDKFSLILGNRIINTNKVKNLMNSISEKNLMELNPIIVNNNFEISDGQHRFTALKNLGLPIVYVIGNNLGLADVQRLNAISSVWTSKDFLTSYCEIGNPNYLRLTSFLESNNLSIPEMFRLWKTGGNTMRDFKTGKLIFDTTSELEMLDIISKFKDFRKSWGKINSSFIDSFKRIIANPEYKHKIMLRKLSIVPETYLQLGAGLRHNLRIMEDVYNYSTTEENRVRFF